jgi:RNA polymerase sigma-70 factor (ECF subfamily)
VTPFARRRSTLEASPGPRSNLRALPSEGRVGDAELVERARRGDRSAEDAIFRRHLDTVAGLALRLLRHRADMEDVVQDTFIIALEKLEELRDGGALRPWLMQIAVSLVRRRLRRRRILRFVGLNPGEADAPLDALASEALDAEACAELAGLDRALAELPAEARIAWMLRYVEGEAMEDVAFACGCSLSTVKRRIAAADARVRLHVRLKEVP